MNEKYPPIAVHVKAGVYSRPYRLEWDYEKRCWNRFDETDDKPLKLEDIS